MRQYFVDSLTPRQGLSSGVDVLSLIHTAVPGDNCFRRHGRRNWKRRQLFVTGNGDNNNIVASVDKALDRSRTQLRTYLSLTSHQAV